MVVTQRLPALGIVATNNRSHEVIFGVKILRRAEDGKGSTLQISRRVEILRSSAGGLGEDVSEGEFSLPKPAFEGIHIRWGQKR